MEPCGKREGSFCSVRFSGVIGWKWKKQQIGSCGLRYLIKNVYPLAGITLFRNTAPSGEVFNKTDSMCMTGAHLRSSGVVNMPYYPLYERLRGSFLARLFRTPLTYCNTRSFTSDEIHLVDLVALLCTTTRDFIMVGFHVYYSRRDLIKAKRANEFLLKRSCGPHLSLIRKAKLHAGKICFSPK